MKQKEYAMELLKNFPNISNLHKHEMKMSMRQYLIYSNKSETARCTCCGAVFKNYIPTFDHRSELKCEQCGAEVTFIASYHCFNGNIQEDERNFVVFLHGKGNDKNLYLSCYNVMIMFEHYKIEPKYIFTETQRYIFTDKKAFRYGRAWEYNDKYYYRRMSDRWELRTKFTEPVFVKQWRNGYVALYEADGGAWKLKARNSIAEYLKNELEELVKEGKIIVVE